MAYIRGLNSLLSKLKALPGITLEGTLDGVQNAVFAIKKDAKDLCPVDSGALRDSIVAEVKTVSPTKLEGTVTAEKDYAVAVEFGTGQLGASSAEITQLGIVVPRDNDIKGRAPTPFLYPAYVANKQDLKHDIIAGLTTEIRKVAKRW